MGERGKKEKDSNERGEWKGMKYAELTASPVGGSRARGGGLLAEDQRPRAKEKRKENKIDKRE